MSLSEKTPLYHVAGRLALLSLFCGLGLVIVHIATRHTIEINHQQYAERQLHELLGTELDPKQVSLVKQNEALYFYAIDLGFGQSDLQAERQESDEKEPYIDRVIESGRIEKILTPEGYNGDITFWLATRDTGTVRGVRVISHQETPGLGDKFDLSISDWVLDFDHRSLENAEWDVKKHGGDFDAFAGATITPKAIIKAIAAHLEENLKSDREQIPSAALKEKMQEIQSQHE
jgi:Na+-translocating ferredoxin:NAD+ oxidoreductase subunit G